MRIAGWGRGHVRSKLRTDVTNAPDLVDGGRGRSWSAAPKTRGAGRRRANGRYVIWLRDPSMLYRRVLWSRAARRRQGLTGGPGRSDGAM